MITHKKRAQVVKRRPPDPGRKKPPEAIAQRDTMTHTITSTADIQKKMFERERRTHILRKVPPATTTSQLLESVSVTLGIVKLDVRFNTLSLTDAVESIIRDSNDRRRFYITYRSYDIKKKFASVGYTIKETVIKPEYGDVSACIPDPPFYMDLDDFISILEPFGTLINPRFVMVNGIRTGALHFDMNLKHGSRLPEFISIDGYLIEIIDKGSLKKCSNCDAFGHIRRECRKLAPQRLQQLERRAMMELEEQMAEDREVASVMDSQETTTPSQQSQSILQGTPPSATAPTTDNVSTQEDGHGGQTRHINIHSLFQEFNEPAGTPMETEKRSVTKEQYQHYISQRKELGTLSRREVASKHYPGRDLETLTKEEWEMMNDDINSRFRELLITAFPDLHYELNLMYINNRRRDMKPP